MNKLNSFVLIIILFSTTLLSQNKVRIYGHVTDFNNNPVDSVSVWLKQNIDSLELKNKDKIFENSHETFTDSTGYFSMEVEPGTYYCLYSIKEVDYGKTKLEYWAWNIPVYKDLEINPQYDRIEIYGISGFEPKRGPFNSYKIYFRPMSLTKAHNLSKETKSDTINIAPNEITEEELTVKVNGTESKIVAIDKIREYTRDDHYMFAYMIQVLKPLDPLPTFNSEQLVDEYDKISVILHSSETNEYGKGEYFIKKIGK
ncbi:carboxypeptidase-like regulatory domain-containing protein [Plebeiibacterium sediminum]|uniref:Carboxypeptidase-like regulatory domain-containing protein n=1 Tax=Plebeiibacterium sediminum TaxID=2992112 RepID=A0AAE3M8K6_9BACT|nr:carboxypeptidase-like regulatory domain-containing protein [Plebeiobacterium sediminum]MCW3789236.1 carboxypeptidase-like regulatory domain-containing protein [Plebeiobacterium sediminum]